MSNGPVDTSALRSTCTIHLTDARVHALSPAVRDALGAARTLALEIADIGPQAMQAAFAQKPGLLIARDDQQLDRQLSPSERQALAAASPGIGLPSAHALSLRPWFVTTLLSRPACEVARQDAGLKPLDMTLKDEIVKRGARIVSLETIGEQLDAMSGLQPSTELAWLRASLALHPRIDDLTETLVQLYLSRRISATWVLSQGLAGASAMSPAQLAEIQQALVVRRNRKMRDASLPLLGKGGVFIAVGALHLPGRDGLVQLLRDAGFTLSAVE